MGLQSGSIDSEMSEQGWKFERDLNEPLVGIADLLLRRRGGNS